MFFSVFLLLISYLLYSNTIISLLLLLVFVFLVYFTIWSSKINYNYYIDRFKKIEDMIKKDNGKLRGLDSEDLLDWGDINNDIY